MPSMAMITACKLRCSECDATRLTWTECPGSFQMIIRSLFLLSRLKHKLPSSSPQPHTGDTKPDLLLSLCRQGDSTCCMDCTMFRLHKGSCLLYEPQPLRPAEGLLLVSEVGGAWEQQQASASTSIPVRGILIQQRAMSAGRQCKGFFQGGS